MATSAQICIKLKNGKLKGVRCNYDGYLKHTGKILLENYNTSTLITKLISLGDISVLEPKMNKPAGHTFSTPIPGHTIFYGRDRGEKNTSAKTYDTIKEIFDYENVDYVYVFDKEMNKWLFCKFKEPVEILENYVPTSKMAKGGYLEGREEYRGFQYQIWYNPKKGMYSVSDNIGVFEGDNEYFKKYDQAKEHAEISISTKLSEDEEYGKGGGIDKSIRFDKQGLMTKLKEKLEIANRAIDKWGEPYQKQKDKVEEAIKSKKVTSDIFNIQGDVPKDNYSIFQNRNAYLLATELAKVIKKYKKYETKTTSTGAASGWSGTAKSTVSGFIRGTVNHKSPGGYYGHDRNYLIAIQIGGGVDSSIRKKIEEEVFPLFYILDEFNGNDGGVCLDVSNGTNYDTIGLTCSKYSFNESAANDLKEIMNGNEKMSKGGKIDESALKEILEWMTFTHFFDENPETGRPISDSKFKKISKQIYSEWDASKDNYNDIQEYFNQLEENGDYQIFLFEKGGMLSVEEEKRFQELDEKINLHLEGKANVSSKEMVEHAKLKHKKLLETNDTYRKQVKNFKYSKGGEIQSFIDDFILDDVDWDDISTKSDLMKNAKEIVVSNLSEYGITKFENLSKEQQMQVKTIVDDEWNAYKTKFNQPKEPVFVEGDKVRILQTNDHTGEKYDLGETFTINFIEDTGGDDLYYGENKEYLFHPSDLELVESGEIPGLSYENELNSDEVDDLYEIEPKLVDPYYPKELIRQVLDIAYYKVIIKGAEYLLAMDTQGNWDDKWYLVKQSKLNKLGNAMQQAFSATYAPKEPGAAGVRIELEEGNINVYHTDSNEILLSLKDVPQGTWKKLWDFLRNDLIKK